MRVSNNEGGPLISSVGFCVLTAIKKRRNGLVDKAHHVPTGGWSARETTYSFAPSVRRREKTATETNEIGSQTARRANGMKRSLFILGIRFVQPHQPEDQLAIKRK